MTTDWLTEVVIRAFLGVQVHDEPMPGGWLCGRCPYPNVGPICTKCGAPRHGGTAFGTAPSLPTVLSGRSREGAGETDE